MLSNLDLNNKLLNTIRALRNLMSSILYMEVLTLAALRELNTSVSSLITISPPMKISLNSKYLNSPITSHSVNKRCKSL